MISPTSDSSAISSKSDTIREDWWNSLFKPTFNIDECQDILNIPSHDVSESSIYLPSDNICSPRGLQHILDDIEEDENIYRRVWRKDRLDNALIKCLKEDNMTADEAVNYTYLCRDLSTQTDICIWDSKELKIIRSCIKDFKRKNYKLEALVKDLVSKNEGLNSKNTLLENKLQKTKDILNEAVKANERFNILTNTLASQLDDCKSRNKYLIEQKTMLSAEQSTVQAKIEELEKNIILKDGEIMKQNKKLKLFESQYKTILDDSVAKVEDKYEKKIFKFQNKLEKLTADLKKECFLHQATEKGFQQLLKHFSETNLEKKAPPDLKSIKYVNKL